MPDYNAIAQRAAKSLAKYGAPAVLERKSTGDYDPTIGEPDDKGTKLYKTVAVRGTYAVRDIDGTRIKIGDVRLYVSGLLAVEPAPGDTIAFDGRNWLVVNSAPIKPAAIVVLHDVQCRDA